MRLCSNLVRPSSPVSVSKDDTRNRRYLQLLPRLYEQLHFRFRSLSPDEREEALQETVCSCFLAVDRMVRNGKEDQIFASPLARFAVAQFHGGRRVGQSRNCRDLFFEQDKFHSANVQSLQYRSRSSDIDWNQILEEDRRTGPAETAAIRIDFQNWINSLPPGLHRVAEFLSAGESAGDAAIRFGVTPGRISQIRHQLYESWNQFQGEEVSVLPQYG